MNNTITKTEFRFPKQKSFYKGKVRDVYNIEDKYLVMIVSDRISAFDVVLPKGNSIQRAGAKSNRGKIYVSHIAHCSELDN